MLTVGEAEGEVESSLSSGMTWALPANAANSGQYDFARDVKDVYPSMDQNSNNPLLLIGIESLVYGLA